MWSLEHPHTRPTADDPDPAGAAGPADGGLGDASTRTYADEGQLGEEPEVLIVADRRVLLNANRSLRLVSVPSGDIDSWPGD